MVLSAFVMLSIVALYTHGQFITVGDISLISTVTGGELKILLTKETFICSASITFNDSDASEVLYNLGHNQENTTLYYRVIANDKTIDTGSILISDDDNLPNVINSNQVSVDETGTTSITLDVSFDESFANNDDISSTSTEMFTITGFTTLVPLIFVILFAVTLKNIYVSLYLAIWIGSFIISACSFRYAFELSLSTYILGSAANEDHQFVIIFTAFLSGLVFLIQRSGGTAGFSHLVSKLAKTGKKTQFAAFLAGIVFFFDDYANALVVGATFMPLTDMFHISREKLAFLVDGTSAPDASLVPLSSWIGFELGQIQQELDKIKANNDGIMPEGLTDNAFVFFVITIPTRFYPIYMLLFQLITIALSVEFGPMLIAQRLCRIEESTDGGRGKAKAVATSADEEMYSISAPAKDTPGRWWNMVIPIASVIILIISVMINSGIEAIQESGDEITAQNIFANCDPWGGLLYGTFGASLIAMTLYVVQFKYKGNIVPPSMLSCKQYLCPPKKARHAKEQEEESKAGDDNEDDDVAVPLVPFSESVEIWIQGIAFMAPAICILVLVWAIGTIMTDIGADRYFTRIIHNGVDPTNLPTLVFILAALISAATGTSWGTMTIMFPLVSPAAWSICEPLENGVFLYTVTLSQILSGAIFGDHSSPLSDTTLLSSVATQCDLFRHVWTQMPYAVWVAFWSIICGTVMIGDGIRAGVCLVVGFIVLTLSTWFVGAPVVTKGGRYDLFTELYIWCLDKCNLCKCRKYNAPEEDKNEQDLDHLVILKNETRAYVRDGGEEDPDYLMNALRLTGVRVGDKRGGSSPVAAKEHQHLQQSSGTQKTTVVHEEDDDDDDVRTKEDDLL